MTKLAYTRAYVDRAAGDDKDTLRFVGATEGEKGDGIALKMDGARLDRYRANPIFGWGHSYWGRANLPIGRSERTEVDSDKRLMFDVAFDRDDAFASEVERKYRKGFLNAVSVGFSVVEWEDPQTMDYYRGGVAEQWELFELSGVPLPMDADAVVESGRALDDALMASLRGLLDRLDADAITQLRQLLDSAAAPSAPPRTEADPQPAPTPVRPGRSLAVARQRLRLAEVAAA
ncbi:MAG TPA: HK97 family phage prohead protease [Micromonosporaceae bacterium]|nr:HK97 family phage prohead protease [Micromonosporaceae bacterium]